MIKDPKSYRIIEEEERRRYLESLTIEESARIVEALLCSRIILKFNFADDDNPLSLSKALKN